MCSPKIDEDLDEEDEVSARTKYARGAIALMTPATKKNRAGRLSPNDYVKPRR
jgi:hypothetical protein